ncbi:MAG: hypothetical protein JNL52_15545 [Flavobacteriales bacterium]|nr:hypothetical protein [Flavobacteriales bacterium]
MNSLIRTLLVAALLGGALNVGAQVDTSLTKEFAGMSAKERTRVAKQETEDAARDPAFQAVMQEAETLFAGQHYDEALERFKEARRMRPLNVYPKVKIKDLEALIAKRDAERPSEPPVEPTVPAPTPVVVAPIPAPQPTKPEPVKEEPPKVDPSPAPVVPPAPAPVVRTAPAERPAPAVATSPTVRDSAKTALPDGTHERIYKEGRAVVQERRVVANGQETVYRKVTHPWGDVVYFQDGLAVPARVWAEVFGNQ